MEQPTEVVETPPVETPPAENVTPTAPSPPNPTLSTEVFQLQQRALSESAAEIQRLQRELAAKNATPVEPPKPEKFFENPNQAIRDEVAAQIKPLTDFVTQMSSERQYESLIQQLQHGAPQLYDLYLKVKPYVDDAMRKVPQPNLQALQFTITSAYGAVAAGLAPAPAGYNPAPVSTPTPAPTPVSVTPPNIPPSPPTPPRRPTAGDELDSKVAAMTEAERTAAKLMGFHDLKQYVQFRDAPPEISQWGGIK